MRKKYAFFIAFMITFVIVGNWLFFQDFSESGREQIRIQRVLDGDTVELEDGRTIRLLNINTEEKGRAFSEEAGDFLKKFEGKSISLEMEGVGKYGRILGRLFEKEYLNLEIVRLGLAHAYLVEDGELKDFKKAEKNARDKELGIWEKSKHYDCLNVEINKYDEYIIIEDSCALNFEGWSIKDESTKMYVFGDVSGKIKLYSGKGKDTINEKYLGRGKIWNNENDAIFIRDSSGFLVYYDSWGY